VLSANEVTGGTKHGSCSTELTHSPAHP
jgi:hypothetical protein